ncbi:hypothetical protein FALCPG4_013601 [Fusarium falciforme]
MRPSGNCPGPNASGLRLGFAYRLFGGISAMQPELHRIAANTWRRRSIPTPRSGDCIASVVHQIARDRGYTCSQAKELKNMASEDARVRTISPSSEKLKYCGKYHEDGYRRIPLAKEKNLDRKRRDSRKAWNKVTLSIADLSSLGVYQARQTSARP